MAKRLGRWVFATSIVAGLVFVLAGTFRDAWLWAYVGVWAAAICVRAAGDGRGTGEGAVPAADGRRRRHRNRVSTPLRAVSPRSRSTGRGAMASDRAGAALRARLSAGRHGHRTGDVLPRHAREPLLLFRRTTPDRPRPPRSRQRSLQHRPSPGIRGTHPGATAERSRTGIVARRRDRRWLSR